MSAGDGERIGGAVEAVFDPPGDKHGGSGVLANKDGDSEAKVRGDLCGVANGSVASFAPAVVPQTSVSLLNRFARRGLARAAGKDSCTAASASEGSSIHSEIESSA